MRPRRVAQPVDAELEIGDRHALVGRMDQLRGEIGRHRARREEAVRDGAERLAEPVAVREAGEQIGNRAGAGLAGRDERLDRLPERRVQRRARSALRLEELQVVLDVAAEHRAGFRLDVRRVLARQQPAVDGRPRTRPGSRCASARRRSSSARASARAAAPGARRGRGPRLASRSITDPADGTSPSTARRNASTSGCTCGSGRYAARRSISLRGLDERVVGDRRHRRVPGAAVHAQQERRAHLLGGRADVEDAAAELDRGRPLPR